MTTKEFLEKRETFVWTSFGRNGNEPGTQTALPQITDSHLVHIIGFMINRPSVYDKETLHLFLREAAYRSEKNIYVEDEIIVPKLKLK